MSASHLSLRWTGGACAAWTWWWFPGSDAAAMLQCAWRAPAGTPQQGREELLQSELAGCKPVALWWWDSGMAQSSRKGCPAAGQHAMRLHVQK